MEGRWPDGTVDVDWRGSRTAAELCLGARARSFPRTPVKSRLVRRRIIITAPEPVGEAEDDR